MFKKTFFACALAAMTLSTSVYANQGSGKVHFKGTVIDAPCGIDPDSVEQTVDFGQISKTYLNGGHKTNPIPFSIKLVNCDPATLKNGVKILFDGATYADKTQLGTTGETKTAIKISAQDGSLVAFGTEGKYQTLIDGDNTLHFSSWVEQAMISGTAATVLEGAFTSTANFNLIYD